jgi:sulfhydrogenase subunit gamma (sulfur reductase)
MTTLQQRFPDQKPEELFVPEIAKITRAENLTEQDRIFEIELPGGKDLGHKPGQFVEVSIFAFGEAPISITSSPAKKGSFELCVRKLGGLTGKMHTLGTGDAVGIRGPLGNGFAMEDFQGADCLIVSGGIGMAPLRSVVDSIMAEREKYGRMTLLYGNRSPADILFTEELEAWGKGENDEVLVTIDRPAEGWEGNVGVVTTLFEKIKLDPSRRTVAIVVGPPIMYRFVYAELAALHVPDDHIYFSLERRMKCGVGKCGNCQIEGKYVCVDGPVFTGEDLRSFHESI